MKKKILLLSLGLILLFCGQALAGSWQKSSAGWSYINDDLSRVKNQWFRDKDGKWYRFNHNGIMQTGWFNDSGGKTYYLNVSGEMITGWVKDSSGFWYYLLPSGELLRSADTPDGYYVNDQGIWLEGLNKAAFENAAKGKG